MQDKRPLPVTGSDRFSVGGHVSPGFEAVREAFADNFVRRRELGAACCVFHCGNKVVDLWGGIRNKQTGEPWEEDTMVILYSATKGLAAMTLAIAHSHGWLDYEERVCTYWPEFAQDGKERITIRQLLAHQAGLYALAQPINRDLVADLDRLAVLASQKPAWEPGTRQAYHAITLGFYEGDECFKGDGVQFSLGFMKPSRVWPFGTPASFGSPGSGGPLGFADPSLGIAYACVTSQMGTALTGDPRDVALRKALFSAVQALPNAVLEKPQAA